MQNYDTIKRGVSLLLEGIGHSKDDPNVLETPDRVARMFGDILNGYSIDPKRHLKAFPTNNNDIVVVRNVPIYSYCSHHMQPFFGKITVAYKPDGEVLGLSKLVRIARDHAKKLQLQENLTAEIAEFIYTHVKCTGVAVNIKAQHMCTVIRGIRSYGAEAVTTKLLGEFTTDKELQAEFFRNLSDKEGY